MIRLDVPDAIIRGRVIAIARRVPPSRLIDVAGIISDVGIAALEVTLDSDDALSSIEQLAGGGLMIGAGTVRSVADAVMAANAGAQFIVMPHTDAEIVRSITARGVPVMPGALTPTEAVTAWDVGRVCAVQLPGWVRVRFAPRAPRR